MATMKKMPAKKAAKPDTSKAAFEKSKFDNDKGVKEGSPADMARDKKEMPAFVKAQKAKAKKGK